MNSQELRELLSLPESVKLDFKREYKLNKTPPQGIDKQKWGEFVKGQWNELIKDIIALTNGNIGTSEQVGRLVIGADDNLSPDGTRQLFDTSDLQLTAQQILAKVNSACDPPIPDLVVEQVVLDGTKLYVISIPPSPHVHETNRQLTIVKGDFNNGQLVNTKEKFYTQYTAFVRTGEDIVPASSAVRRALESDKKFELVALSENIKHELLHNLKYLLEKSKEVIYNPGVWYQYFRENVRLESGKIMDVEIKYIKALLMAYVTAMSAYQNLSTQFIDYAVESGKYLTYNISEGRYERSLFLDYLHELQISIRKFKKLTETVKLSDFLEKYNLRGITKQHLTIRCDDFLFITAMLSDYDDVINISVALLAYLLGDRSKLEQLKLNPISPLADEAAKIEEETPKDTEIIDWVLNKQQ